MASTIALRWRTAARSIAGLPRGPGEDITIDASVVICAYTEDRWTDLSRAVRSVEDQHRAPRRIVVVIDHNAALLARARRELHSAHVVANRGLPGLSGARNTGIAVADGEVVAFVDDDAHADRRWLGRLLDGYVDQGVFGVGGLVEADWDVPRPAWFPPEFDWVVGCSYRGLPSRPTAVRNPIGCNMSFRRAVFDAVGGFRSEVGRVGANPIGCEETELSIRAAAHSGGRFVYDPGAVVRHRVPAARARWSYFHQRCFAEGRSKAVVRRLARSAEALSAERSYVRRTLPLGMRDAVAESLRIRHPLPLLRIGAIVAGTGATVAGFISARSEVRASTPVAVGEGSS
jgi:GT2 family glycosyltransferase